MKPSRSSATSAYDLLLDEIEKGGLSAGTRLREADLAERFQISRTPVREALKRLETQGLVVHEPHHGAVVATLDYAETAELYFMREVLEGTAARLAAIHATATERENPARDGRPGPPARRPAGAAGADQPPVPPADPQRGRATGSSAACWKTCASRWPCWPAPTLGAPNRGARSVEEHGAIVECIATQNPEGAEEAARLHIRNAFRTRIELLQT